VNTFDDIFGRERGRRSTLPLPAEEQRDLLAFLQSQKVLLRGLTVFTGQQPSLDIISHACAKEINMLRLRPHATLSQLLQYIRQIRAYDVLLIPHLENTLPEHVQADSWRNALESLAAESYKTCLPTLAFIDTDVQSNILPIANRATRHIRLSQPEVQHHVATITLSTHRHSCSYRLSI
jgi:hypothetical protein